MSKNLVLAFTLSLAVYAGWAYWMQKQYPPRKAPAAAAAQGEPRLAENKLAPSISPKTVPLEGQSPRKSAPLAGIPFRTPETELMFSPRGAGIASFQYFGPVSIAELVPHSEPGFFATMTDVEFRLKERTNDAITFTAEPARGVVVEKVFRWSGNGLGSITITAVNRTAKSVELPAWGMHLGPGIGTVATEKEENPKLWKAVYVAKQEGRKNPVVNDLSSKKPQDGWLWAGVDNRYFLAAIIPQNWRAGDIAYAKKEDAPSLYAVADNAVLQPGQPKTWSVQFYFGPKDYRQLTSLGHGLDRAVDFGFFGPLGKFIMKILYFNHKITGNYGWAIILLTLLVQAVMFPLTLKSFKANLIMRKIQPKLQEIQKRNKDNPQRMNAEMMELYKKQGANPFGGCLPMLLQLPVFVALFTALRNSWDLHGAHFMLWIGDLSAKDPYYVLPIVMGGIMFFQNKMTLATQGTDPSQAAVMKWMPVIFTFMFLSFPSGLVLYWLVSNVIGFGQQLYLQRKMEGTV
ncbi:MAG: membrane protein insertase YidC [Elusimicrobiales bacterium]